MSYWVVHNQNKTCVKLSKGDDIVNNIMLIVHVFYMDKNVQYKILLPLWNSKLIKIDSTMYSD